MNVSVSLQVLPKRNCLKLGFQTDPVLSLPSPVSPLSDLNRYLQIMDGEGGDGRSSTLGWLQWETEKREMIRCKCFDFIPPFVRPLIRSSVVVVGGDIVCLRGGKPVAAPSLPLISAVWSSSPSLFPASI